MINVKSNSKHQIVTEQKGPFKIIEYTKDPSVNGYTAEREYFMGLMNVRRRQLQCALNGQNMIVTQAGAMQWTAGNVESRTGIKGAGDMLGKLIKGSVTGESAVKPEYVGQGVLVLEPTFKHIILEDVGAWGPAGIVLEDGMFYACEGSIAHSVVARSNFSSATAGREGLFNLALRGKGYAALESSVPREELIEIELDNDMVKIDGSYAVCWSGSLQFTVERSSKSIIGSAMNGEGFVNVYRGTGKILLAPLASKYSNHTSIDG